MKTETFAPPSTVHGRRVLVLAFGATMSMVLGVSGIMPMVPALAKVFGISVAKASLVITVFTLPGVVFTLFAGLLADRFGRRAVLVPSLSLFCFAGAACAFAGSFEMLLFFRFVQGIGAAPLGVLNTTIIADTWSGRTMSTLIGYNVTILSVGTAIYPSLGGALAVFDWRYPFLLPLLALPVLYVALKTPLANPGSAGTCREYVAEISRIFHTRRIVGLLGITGLTFVLLYGPIITSFPVLADAYFHASPAAIGLVMAFSSVGAALTASQLGRLYGRFTPRGLLLFSQVLYVASLAAVINVPGLWWAILPILAYGMGQGLIIPNVQAQLLAAATPAQRASVMAANGMLLRIGQTLAPVTFGFIMVTRGIPWGFYLGMALSAGIVALTLAYVPKRG
ncbi:Major facilitator superfamily MFS_1 [uncultured delta proteobacterium]|uniref:Major facilitator superfamily MFS_1 n=1 Tax=uncultured delta proteobacterium TaxID=34034 RepID=A0A212KF19_9DELT|nr:Major facilitator superfamily MFS_1 [uncultured delta proteobacterium]